MKISEKPGARDFLWRNFLGKEFFSVAKKLCAFFDRVLMLLPTCWADKSLTRAGCGICLYF